MSPQQCRLRLTLRGHTPHCARGVPVRTSRTTDEAACWLPAPWRGAAAAKRSQAGRGNSLHTDVDAAGRPRAAPCKSEWRASNLPNCAAACPLLSLGRTASAFSTRTVLSAQYQSPHSAPPSEPGRVLEPWVVVRQSVPLRRPCRRRPGGGTSGSVPASTGLLLIVSLPATATRCTSGRAGPNGSP